MPIFHVCVVESESAALIAKCPQLHWRLVIPLCTSLECQRAQSVYCTIQVQQNQNGGLHIMSISIDIQEDV